MGKGKVVELIGPIEAELVKKDTGKRYFIDLWLCSKCKHPVNSEEGIGQMPINITGCTHGCRGCECDRSN